MPTTQDRLITADPYRVAEAFPRRRPSPRHSAPAVPTADEIEAARRDYVEHIPSMFTHQCLGCDQRWPCHTYREAVTTLQLEAGTYP